MKFARLNDVTLHYRYVAGDGVPIVFLNSLGTDFRIWDAVIENLGDGTPHLCVDKRGHGLTDNGPISMDLLVQDVAALMDHLSLKQALICGVSVGGMMAQRLAIARPDLVTGLVLLCTGAQIGDADGWNARINAVQNDGIASMANAILQRWFSDVFRNSRTAELAGYSNMLTRTSAEGYAGVCAALRDSDFTDDCCKISVPTVCIAGEDDLATPPPLLQELARLISGATYESIHSCGHLPCIEAPDVVAKSVRGIMARIE